MSTSQPNSYGDASNLELSLLSVSIFTSFILYSISVKAASRIYDKGRRPFLFTFIFFIAALVANGIIVATVVLAYKRKISLDAIAAVVFALIPGLVSFPRDAFMEVFVYATIIYLRVFPVCYKNFSYVTFGRPCNEDMLPEDTPFSGCAGEACTANIYIRKLMLSNAYFPTFSTKIFRCKKMRNRIEEERRKSNSFFRRWFFRRPEINAIRIRWNGQIVQHEESVITVRNLLPVPEQKWYLQLSSAMWLVMEPWTVHLSRPAQVVCVLRVISDIMSIGRLIILFRGEMISELINDLDFDNDNKAKAAVQICNAIIKEIGLNEWGQLDIDQLRNHETNSSYKLDQLGEMYSLILLLVIYKSNLFGNWFHPKSGQEERNNFYEFGDDETDEDFLKMEEGTSIRSITKLEHIEVEGDTSLKYGVKEEMKDDKQGPTCSKTKQLKISRAERIAGLLRWIGWLVNGTMPFHDPLEVAHFRHLVTSFKVIKKIQKAAVNGKCTCELESVMEEQVDQWLASWKCKITKSLSML